AVAVAVARDERIRLRCPACGKTGSMAAADFAKLKESGRRVACSACKAPLDGSSAVTERMAPGTESGGTMRISSSGSSGAHALPRDPGPAAGGTTALSARGGSDAHTSPRTPKATPAGTMALSASGSHGEQPSGSDP